MQVLVTPGKFFQISLSCMYAICIFFVCSLYLNKVCFNFKGGLISGEITMFITSWKTNQSLTKSLTDLALIPNMFIVGKRNVVFDYLTQFDFPFSWERAFYPFPQPLRKEKLCWNKKIWTGQISFLLLGVLCVHTTAQLMPYSVRPHVLQPVNLLCLWNFTGKNTGVDCHSLH